jgi:hypothetical protein
MDCEIILSAHVGNKELLERGKNTEKCNDQRIIIDFISSPKINSRYDLKIVLSRFIAILNAKH